MTGTPDKDLEQLLGAYLDGELDAATAADIEKRVAADPAAAAALERLSALGTVLRAARDADVPAADLKRRIETLALPAERARPRQSWRALAAAVLVGVLVGAVGTWLAAQYGQANTEIADAVFANNLRALMASDPVEIASTDKHTVKPWFDGKLTYAPTVVDLADQGYPLIGGRVDIVALQPVAALVYRYNQHIVTVTEIPNSTLPPVVPAAERGFVLRAWQTGSVAYWAVSDITGDEMTGFVALFKAALAGP